MSKQLKSCPFCGSDDIVRESASKPYPDYFVCQDCGANADIAAWNTRAPTSPPPVSRQDRLPSVEEVARVIEPRAWEKGEGFKWRYRDALDVQAVALSKASAILGMVGGGSSGADIALTVHAASTDAEGL